MSAPALISGYKARVAHAVPASKPARVPLRANRRRLRRLADQARARLGSTLVTVATPQLGAGCPSLPMI